MRTVVMADCGSFDYVAVVPDAPTGPARGRARGWPVTLRELVERTGRAHRDNRLVGYAPRLRIEDAGLPPDAPLAASAPCALPRVLRSRITLTATGRAYAQLRAAHFHVARGLTAALEPKDVLHVQRNGSAALSLSVLRGGRLVVAIGAVTGVPLGDDVAVRTSWDYWDERVQRLLAGGTVRPGSDAERALFRDVHRELRRDMPGEQPVELRIDGQWHACPRGDTDLGAYAIHVVRGFHYLAGGPGMCVAIARRGGCPADAATASAQLLVLDPLVMDWWDEDPS